MGAQWLLLLCVAVFTPRPVSTVKVVAYNNIRGYLNWDQPFFTEMFQKFLQSCPVPCSVSYDKRDIGAADVVFFLGSTFQKTTPKFPKNKKRHQIYVLHSMEQPRYVPLLKHSIFLDKSFDLMYTYSQSQVYPGTKIPNIPLSYFPSHVYTPDSVLLPAQPFASTHVVAFISNCKKAGGEERMHYIRQLGQHIAIDHYGGCTRNKIEPELIEYDGRWPKQGQRRARKLKVLSNYKFYLAFENARIEDYVSEKVYEGLLAGTLPVYRGATNIESFLPRKSIINANNMDPKDLAGLLHILSKDEAMYNSYFDFKNHTLPTNFSVIANQSYCHPSAICRLCSYYSTNIKLKNLI